MHVQLYYGDDVLALERAVTLLRQQYEEVVRLTPPFSYSSCEEALSNLDLFGTHKLVIVENLLQGMMRGKPSKVQQQLIALINTSATTVDILLVDSDEKKSKQYTSLFPGVRSQGFTVPKYLFQFLDALKPRNLSAVYRLYEGTLGSNAAELIFYFLKRRVRDLMNAQVGVFGVSVQPWQRTRLLSQAQAWPREKLEKLYGALFTIEEGIKGGKVPYDTQRAVSYVLQFYC